VTRNHLLHYPIRAVSRMTGLSLDTLRAWERRYDAVTPQRGERGRLYTQADVTRLQHLAQLVARGHAIGTVARLEDAQIARLAQSTEALTPDAAVPLARLDPITAALDRYDVGAIETALNRYAAVLLPRDLIVAVVLPLLSEIGARWQAGTLRPAQEHLISAIVRSVLGGLLRVFTRTEATLRVVFAAPSGERHELGLLCAAVLAASNGAGTVYLGPDLPAADIWRAATGADAQLVVVGLTMPGAVARAELRQLAAPPRGIRVCAGGSAAPDLLSLAGEQVHHLEDVAAIVPQVQIYAR
jgi:DNA-binding transcriptional MerR regulator/methylmalonyl-CoA mutase cobalamin-binding subunit